MKMKKTLMGVLLLILLIVNLGFSSALTGSIGNAKAILYPEVNGWTNTVIDRTVLVKNVNEVPIIVNLSLDSEGKDFIKLIDESFVLQPDEEKKAEFEVRVKKEGRYEGRINVFFAPEDPEIKEPGVVLSSKLVVMASKDKEDYKEENEASKINDGSTGSVIKDNGSSGMGFLIVSSLVLLIILFTLFYLMEKKRKVKSKNSKKKK